MRYLIPLMLLALAGCATTRVDPNHQASLQAYDRERQSEAMQIASLADASHCKDDRCVENTKAMAALVAVARGAQGSAGVPQAPRQLDWTEKAANLSRALTPWGGFAVQIEGQRFARDNVRSANETQLGIIDRLAGGWERSSTAAATVPRDPTYSYNIGRDYVPGQIGDNAGRDQIGGNQHVGDWRTGDNIARDTIGRDRTDYGTGNRIDSPGPYRDVGNEGPRCTGIGCQTVNPLPEPEPEE
jgi:hypothetical protein